MLDKKSYTIYREGSITNIEAKESLSPVNLTCFICVADILQYRNLCLEKTTNTGEAHFK